MKNVKSIAKNIEYLYGVTNLLSRVRNTVALVGYSNNEVAKILGNIAGTFGGCFNYIDDGILGFNISCYETSYFEIISIDKFKSLTTCNVYPHTSLKGVYSEGDLKSIKLTFIVTANNNVHCGSPRNLIDEDINYLSSLYKKVIKDDFKYVNEYINVTKDINQAYELYNMDTFGEENAMDFIGFSYVYNLIMGD